MIALSHSKISDYDQCALKFALKYIFKNYLDDKDNPYFVKGQRIHKMLEDYVVWKLSGEDESKRPAMNQAAKNALPIVDGLMKRYDTAFPEQKLAIDKNLQKVGWFDKSTIFRCIFDFLVLNETDAVAVDYKTGKVTDYSGFGGQLHLSGWMLFKIRPEIEVIRNAYLYLEHKKTTPILLQRSDVPKLEDHFLKKFDQVNAEKNWDPTRNQYCGYCNATAKQCKYKKQEL